MKSAVVLMSVIVPAIGVVSMSIAGWAQAPQGGAPLVDGIWQTYVPTGGLWTVTLKLDGTQLTGSVYQDMDDPTDIYEGRVEDRTVVFKTDNDDSGCRTITFTGKVNAGEIAFTRDVQVREGCNPGGTGIYGARAVREFAAKRVAEWNGLLSPSPSSHTAAYPPGNGPVVLWDRGHHNFHVGSVKVPEAQRAWVSRDGYVVRPFDGHFDNTVLSEADIVVTSLALAAANELERNWALPTPSAFSASEIDALVDWVAAGGALLLGIEHMPFGGAYEELASAFGVRVLNAFVWEEPRRERQPFMYRRADGTLLSHPVTEGRTDVERVDAVSTESGGSCAFRLPPNGQSLLTLGSSAMAFLPEVAFQFSDNTPRQPVGGWSQAGVMRFGRGRLAVLCEYGLLTAPELIPPGTSDDERRLQHPRLTLNLFHWLSGLLPSQ
jgi:hypothetical protein